MRHPIITLTTDFGLESHYAAAMKGVILGIAPAARVVDVTHLVTPFAITEAAYTIAQAWRWFPKRTIHVVVVDPGVGSARRPILVAAGGHYFVGPDNGVFSMIFGADERHRVRVLSSETLFLPGVSRTFHGRDIFAPVAAHLANGVSPARVGKLVDDALRLTFDKPIRTGKRTWSGQILAIDRFGNLVTSLHRDQFPDLEQRQCELSIGPHRVGVLARSYAETSPGELFLIIGSGGFIEVSASQTSAARIIDCEVGAPADLVLW